MIRVLIGNVPLPYVQHVQKSAGWARDAYVTGAGKGVQEDTYDIRGYILGSGTTFFTQQKTLEDALAALGETTVTIGALTPFDGRVSAIEWEPYHCGPLLIYTIKVIPKAKSNPFAGLIEIGTLILDNPTPALTEQYRVVSEDEKMSATFSRIFRIQGRFMGTPTEVQNFIEDLEQEVTGSPDGYFAFTTPMGAYEAKAREFNVERPEQIETAKAVTYQITVETRADYSLEFFNLPHDGLNIGGLGFDVLNSFSHSVDRVRKGTGATFKVTGESITWSVKKYFTSVDEADTFKPNFEALVNNRNVMNSPTGAVLECKSVSYNVVSRDGHYTDGSRRYSITVSITFSKPSNERENPGGTAFGVIFDEITSDSRGVSIDEHGGITNRNRNVSGKVTSLPASNLLGSSVSEADGTYYVTGVNIGKLDDDGRWEISISGRTLDSEEQCASFIEQFFSGVHLRDVTNQTRSVSQQFVEHTNSFETTSLSETISGYVWGQSAQGLLDLVTLAAGAYNAAKITNVSIGKEEPFTDPATKACTFKQNVSMTRVTNYATTPDPEEEEEEEEENQGFDPDQPDVKEETTISFSAQTDRFTVITVPGGNIIYKKIGVNPATAQTRVARTAKNFTIFNGMAAPGKPSPNGVAQPIETRDEQGEQGLTKWHETEWMSGAVQ